MRWRKPVTLAGISAVILTVAIGLALASSNRPNRGAAPAGSPTATATATTPSRPDGGRGPAGSPPVTATATTPGQPAGSSAAPAPSNSSHAGDAGDLP